MEEKEKKEAAEVVEDEKKLTPEEEAAKKSEADAAAEKDEFEKKEEFVPAGKYNAAVRKQRELEIELREARKTKEEKPAKKVVVEEKEEEDDEEEDEEEFYPEKKTVKKASESEEENPLAKDIKELKSRLDQREADDKKKQRSAFFKAHPEYLTNPEKWNELLDEMDNSLNPHSKDGYYKQLIKAHRLISNDAVSQTDIEKKKAEMASEAASKGDGSQKAPDNNKSAVDDRAKRLAMKMPKGYQFKVKEE